MDTTTGITLTEEDVKLEVSKLEEWRNEKRADKETCEVTSHVKKIIEKLNVAAFVHPMQLSRAIDHSKRHGEFVTISRLLLMRRIMAKQLKGQGSKKSGGVTKTVGGFTAPSK